MKQPSQKGRSLPRVTLRLAATKREEIMTLGQANYAESLSSAVRRLIDHGLSSTKPKAPRSTQKVKPR